MTFLIMMSRNPVWYYYFNNTHYKISNKVNVRYKSGEFQFWSQECIGNGLRGADKSMYLDTVKKRKNHFQLFSLAHSCFSGVFNSPENIHPFLLAFALDHTGNFFWTRPSLAEITIKKEIHENFSFMSSSKLSFKINKGENK